MSYKVKFYASNVHSSYFISFLSTKCSLRVGYILLLISKHLAPTRSVAKDIKYAAISQSLVLLARLYTIMSPSSCFRYCDIIKQVLNSWYKSYIDLDSPCQLRKYGLWKKDCAIIILLKKPCNPLYPGGNTDANIGTIDGKNTLHVMGMIRSSISSGKFSDKIIESFPTTEELPKNLIPIFYKNKIEKKLVNIVLKEIELFNFLAKTNLAAKCKSV